MDYLDFTAEQVQKIEDTVFYYEKQRITLTHVKMVEIFQNVEMVNAIKKMLLDSEMFRKPNSSMDYIVFNHKSNYNLSEGELVRWFIQEKEKHDFKKKSETLIDFQTDEIINNKKDRKRRLVIDIILTVISVSAFVLSLLSFFRDRTC